MNRSSALLLLFAALAAWPSASHAQSFSRVDETRTNIGAYYFYVQPGAATVQVRVIGTVRNPGVYDVSQGTTLGTLLALSGGPLLDRRLETVERRVTIRLIRPTGYGDRPIYEATLDEAVSRVEAYPVLQDGDVLTVDVVEKQKFNWRDVITVIGGASAVALVVERIVAIQR